MLFKLRDIKTDVPSYPYVFSREYIYNSENHLISIMIVTFPSLSMSFKDGTIMKLSLLIYPSLFRVTSTFKPDQQPLQSQVKPPIVDITSSFSAVLIIQVLEANKVRRYKLKLPRDIR